MLASTARTFTEYSGTIFVRLNRVLTGLCGPVVNSADLNIGSLTAVVPASLGTQSCEMPSSALVGQVVFLWVLRFLPTSD